MHELNTGTRRRDRGGLTRLELFAQDPTERLFLSPEAARLACMRTDKDFYRSSKSGIQVKNRTYVCAELVPGRSYQVRYLPNRPDFIEVFDINGAHVGRAYNQETLAKPERDRILATRARQERDVAAIEEGIRQHRVHKAAVDNAAADHGQAASEDSEASVVELHPARNSAVDKAPKRKKLPRVPATPTRETAQSIEETQRDYRQILDSPFGQDVAALVAQLNADRAANRTDGTDDEH